MAMRRGYPSGVTAMRLRLRRMLFFLKRYGLIDVARELEKATGVFFDAAYVKHLMRMGSWEKADDYLHHFLPSQHRSEESLALIIHIRSAWTLAAVAQGGPDAAEFASTFDGQFRFPCPRVAKFRKLLHKMHADQPRSSVLWKNVAPSAVNLAMDLAAKCPELKNKLQLPRDRPMPWEVTPLIGARGPQRHRSSSKSADRTPADVLSCAFMRQKRLHSIQETTAYSGLPSNASSSYVALHMKTEQIAPKPIILGGVPSNASSSSVALNTKTEQIAPEPIILGGNGECGDSSENQDAVQL